MIDAKLAHMANQIAANLGAYPEPEARSRMAEHLRSFWTPAMIVELESAVRADPGLLVPVAAGALADAAAATRHG